MDEHGETRESLADDDYADRMAEYEDDQIEKRGILDA